MKSGFKHIQPNVFWAIKHIGYIKKAYMELLKEEKEALKKRKIQS